MSESATAEIIETLGFTAEIARLRAMLDEWMGRASREMQPMLDWQFVAKSKYFRPLTVFSCHRALHPGPIPDSIVRSATVLAPMPIR